MLQGFHFSWVRPILTHLLRRYFEARGVRVRILFPLLFTAGLEWILSREKGVSPGAIHYYLAVGGSLVAIESNRGTSAWRLHARMAVYSWIPGAILELAHDRVLSFMTPFYSWISIPPISIFLYPATAGARILGGDFPDTLVAAWSLWMRVLIKLADSLPAFARISEGAWVPALVLVIVQEWIPIRRRVWILPGLLILARLLWMPPHSARVILWNVGQGDAALFVQGERAELVDAGPAFRADPSQWIRRLARAGVGSLQGVLLTHLDADHRGGLDWIAPIVPIDCVEVHDVREALLKVSVSLHGLLRQHACVRNMEIAWFRSSKKGGNQWMAGLVFPLSKDQAYFALGDGDRMQERLYAKWVAEKAEPFTIRIWKAGHHGSRYSSDPLLISSLNPTEIWVSVGARNGYGHPSAEALERLVRGGATIHRTDVEGDLAASSRE
jgi:competence protein ComEC